MYCNTIELYCEKRARQGWTVLQYSAQPSHNAVTVAATERQGAGQGCWGAQVGVRRRGRVGARAGAFRASVLECVGRACWGRRAAGARARAGAQDSGRRAGAGGRASWRGTRSRRTLGRRARGRAAAGLRRRWAAGRWARDRALGARGWPRAVHSVHLTCFWLISTLYFS